MLLKDKHAASESLSMCREVLADESVAWEAPVLEAAFRKLSEDTGVKLGKLLQSLRVAVCGNMVSPPLFESMELMKRADVLARIDA